MPEIICPDCGATNPADAAVCTRCNFPIRDVAAREAGDRIASQDSAATSTPVSSEPISVKADAASASAATAASAPAAVSPEPEPGELVSGFDPGPRPVRRRRPRPDAMQPIQMQIWLFVGVLVVLGVIYFAAQGFWRSNAIQVAGARPDQQQRADLARRALEADSTNLAARIDLANVLYDTGNWSEAIIHYRSAERADPQRATTVVDLGVCYYNLGQFAAAESLFHRALAIDPQQVFALFNLGIVAESQERWDEALDFFHRAVRANPPEPMKVPLEQHLQAIMERTGKKPPPLQPR